MPLKITIATLYKTDQSSKYDKMALAVDIYVKQKFILDEYWWSDLVFLFTTQIFLFLI